MRAGIAETPEDSEHTSIQRRIHSPREDAGSVNGLMPFRPPSGEQQVHPVAPDTALPLCFDEYLALLDWTGQQMCNDNKSYIPADIPDIFTRLNYSPSQWMKSHQPSIPWQQRALGSVERILSYCQALQRRWIWQAADHEIR